MRKVIFVALLLLLSIAKAQELEVSLGEETFAGPNCRSDGQPNSFEFQITITNPSQNALNVFYEWYNSSSGEFVSGGKICDVIPGSINLQPCKVTLYSVLGGTNGTNDMSFNVIGTDVIDTWRKTLTVTLNHYPGAIELNAMNRIDLANNRLLEVNSTLATCYDSNAEELLNSASSELRDAIPYLKICNIAKTLDLANDALNKIGRANESIGAIPLEQCKPKEAAPPEEVPPSTAIQPNATQTAITSIMTTVKGKTSCFGITLLLLGAVALILTKK